jgi:O-antigen/teichoic acid export membrane protein
MTTQSLKKRAISGAIWTIVGYGGSQILRFGSNLILTRLLIPEYFGLMAIINTLLAGIHLFSDLGVGQSIIHNKRGEEEDFLDTAWSVQIVRGFIIWGVCLLATIPLANFYNDPRLLSLIPIVGFSGVIDGFQTTRYHLAQRRIELQNFIFFELSVQILSITALVTMAYFWPTVWALAINSLISTAIQTGMGFIFFPGPWHRWLWEKEAIKDLTSFGRWIFLASAMMFIAEQSDRLILGKIIGLETLGIFTIAYTLANIPREILKTLSYRVIMPLVAQSLDLSRSELRQKILTQRQKLLLLCVPCLSLLIVGGDRVIDLLYGDRYIQATWMMPIICLGLWFSILFQSISETLVAIGKPAYLAPAQFIRFLAVAIGIPVGYHFAQTPGAICALAVSDLPLYFTNLFALTRERLSPIAQDLQMTFCFVVTLGMLLTARYQMGFGLPIENLLKLMH